MRIVNVLWVFYKKLILPSIVVSALLASFYFKLGEIVKGTGMAYIFLAPVFHYLLYDFTSPKEYYFYYNMGLSKVALWVNTILMSLIISVVLMLI